MQIQENTNSAVCSKLNNLKKLRFGFHQLIYIRPTQKCPLNCKHCSANSKPDGNSASEENLHKWIQNICQHGGVKWIGIEGGEPFAVLPQLRTMLETCHECGFKTAVLTSGFWAKSERKARSILSSLPSSTLLMVSADKFHQEQIPVKRVRLALEAALEWADTVALQVCLENKSNFLENLYKDIGEKLISQIGVIVVPLQFSGRARVTGVASKPPSQKELPDNPCIFLGTPVVREDGLFVACCQQDVVLRDKQSALHLGNLKFEDASTLMRKADQDVYIQTLRVYGPRPIADFAIKFGYSWHPKKVYSKNCICDLCRELSVRWDIVEGFRKARNNDEYWREINVARLILYQERFKGEE